ncbi:hypothetical protein T484DRAFT_1828118, partial [Baffinella frigidus]
MSQFRVVAAGASCGFAGFCAGAVLVSRAGTPPSDCGGEGASRKLGGIARRAEFGVARCEKGERVGTATAPPASGKWPAQVSLESLRSTQAEFARVRGWEQHHLPRSIALALVGEAGELCECFQWKKDKECEGGLRGWSEEERVHLGEELSDVLLYLVRLSDVCDVDLA